MGAFVCADIEDGPQCFSFAIGKCNLNHSLEKFLLEQIDLINEIP